MINLGLVLSYAPSNYPPPPFCIILVDSTLQTFFELKDEHSIASYLQVAAEAGTSNAKTKFEVKLLDLYKAEAELKKTKTSTIGKLYSHFSGTVNTAAEKANEVARNAVQSANEELRILEDSLTKVTLSSLTVTL